MHRTATPTHHNRYVADSGYGFHSVEVNALNIGGSGGTAAASIKVGESAILDTGTNVLLLPSKVCLYDAVRAHESNARGRL